ncbi:MAG: DM13 domain-containing protein [Cyanobacteria bacterium P01_A01_bin.40]
MKRFVTFSTIALSVLPSCSSSVSSIEDIDITGALKSIDSESLPVKAKTSSQFVIVNERIQTVGTLKIIEENGDQYIEFGHDFQTVDGTDLEIILHKNQTVGLKIVEGEYLTISPIQSLTGAQRYTVPEGVDLDEYGSVAVWCEEFNITFGYAQL